MLYGIMYLARKLAYNKKGIPNSPKLGTIQKWFCTNLCSWYYFY